MIQSDYSGVIFTANPTGILNEMVIVAGEGLGCNIVEDKISTTTYYYNVDDKNYYFENENIFNRNLLGGLYRENLVKSRNYEAVKSSKKWENVGNSYIIPALLLYRYSYI